MKRKHENFVLPFLLSFRVRLLQKGVFFCVENGFWCCEERDRCCAICRASSFLEDFPFERLGRVYATCAALRRMRAHSSRHRRHSRFASLPPNNPRTPLYVLSRRTGCRVIAYSTAHDACSSAVLCSDCCFAIKEPYP